MPNFPLTDEQQAVVAAAPSGQHIIAEAGAGTGKTSTLGAVAEALPTKRILLLCFSKALQLEAALPGKFPSNVEARTAHSLAYREFGGRNKRRLKQYPTGKQVAYLLSIRPFKFMMDGEEDTIQPAQLGTVVRETIKNFAASADCKVTRWHIPKSKLHNGDHDAFNAHVLPYAEAAWKQIADPTSTFPFMPGRGDGCYLKLWSLSNPQLPYDVILFDEAQDADPAIAHVVDIQRNAQKILVGDSAQAIFGWRGAVDAMKNFDADHHFYLSQSFRFGQPIADEANRLLNIIGTELRLKGFDKIESQVAPTDKPDAVLCRTNAGVIESAMNFIADGYKVAIVGGSKQIEGFVKAAAELMDDRRTDYPELATYHNWDEVCVAVDKGEADDIGMMVRLVNNYGVAEILSVCKSGVKPADADILVSTAHKAKGLEWDSVRIHNDFRPPKEGNELSISEAMLIYVAITRAKKNLDNSALAWLDQFERDINSKLDEGEAA